MDESVPIERAAASTGIPARTLRYWIAHGKLPAVATPRCKLVQLADVWHVADLTGRPLGNGDGSSPTAVATSPAPARPRSLLAASDAVVFAHIRDEWIQPLVVQIAYQAECIGRLEERAAQAECRAIEAERRLAAEQVRRERAEVERDGARRQVKELALARLRARAEQSR